MSRGIKISGHFDYDDRRKMHVILWAWIWQYMGIYFWWVVPHEVLHGMGVISQAILIAFAGPMGQENAWFVYEASKNNGTVANASLTTTTTSTTTEIPIVNCTERGMIYGASMDVCIPDGSGLATKLMYYGSVALLVSLIQLVVPLLFCLADVTCYKGQIDVELNCILEEKARGFFCFYCLMHILFVTVHVICFTVVMNDLYFRYEAAYFFYSATLAETIWNSGVLVGLLLHC